MKVTPYTSNYPHLSAISHERETRKGVRGCEPKRIQFTCLLLYDHKETRRVLNGSH